MLSGVGGFTACSRAEECRVIMCPPPLSPGQVCRLDHATSLLNELTRQSKGAPAEKVALYAEALSTISSAAQQASKLNATVYTELVPSLASLPPIEPKSIVKPMVVAELGLSEEGGRQEDLFARLVPLTVLQDASIYTAERDQMLRELAAMEQTAKQVAEAEMEGMDLPHALQVWLAPLCV